MRSVWLSALAIMTGCAGTPNDQDDLVFADDSKADGDTSGIRVCASQHTGKNADGDAVAFCDALFDAAPRVTLPDDEIASDGGSSTLYAALDLAGVPAIIARDGTSYTLVDSSGAAVSPTKLPKSLHMPSHRALFTLYQLTGTITTYKDPYSSQSGTAFHLTAGKPIVVIDGKVIDGAYLAPAFAFEGTVSRRIDDGNFDSENPVPIRISFTTLDAWVNMPSWTSGTLADGTRFQTVGTIDNFSEPVLASDGTCMPSFASLGAANTWQGATSASVKLYRFPGMHFPADEVHVFDYPLGTAGLSQNGMGGMSVTHPAALIQTAPNDTWSTLHVYPHAKPNGHAMQLHPVTGGGGACS